MMNQLKRKGRLKVTLNNLTIVTFCLLLKKGLYFHLLFGRFLLLRFTLCCSFLLWFSWSLILRFLSFLSFDLNRSSLPLVLCYSALHSLIKLNSNKSKDGGAFIGQQSNAIKLTKPHNPKPQKPQRVINT